MLEQILREIIASDTTGGEVVVEDFVLEVGRSGPLATFRIDHETVAVIEKPLAVRRELHLFNDSEVLRIVLGLCLEGPGAALEWLHRMSSAFQREPKTEDIRRLELDKGAIGFCWSWVADESVAYAAFVRHNLIVTQNGRLATIRAVASAIDRNVRELRAAPASGSVQGEVRQVGSIAVGGQVDMPVADAPGSQLFFIATGGAVNRDSTKHGHYYYRAGQRTGPQTIDVLRVGQGLLPERTRLSVQIG